MLPIKELIKVGTRLTRLTRSFHPEGMPITELVMKISGMQYPQPCLQPRPAVRNNKLTSKNHRNQANVTAPTLQMNKKDLVKQIITDKK